jgi:hypothetical protein
MLWRQETVSLYSCRIQETGASSCGGGNHARRQLVLLKTQKWGNCYLWTVRHLVNASCKQSTRMLDS